MSSKSIQHSSYRTQPHYQVACSKNLPQTKPKERRKGPSNVSLEKKKRGKIQFLEEFEYIQKMMQNPKTGYNWRILRPKKLGYVIVECWSNFTHIRGRQRGVSKTTSEKPILWGFIHPNNGFIYLGNQTETWKLGLSHSYFNPKYFTGKEDPLALLDKLVMPLDL